jgi:hypothetical protein
MKQKYDLNQVHIFGRITSGFIFNEEMFLEGGYMMYVAVKRLSGKEDIIPVMVSGNLLDFQMNYIDAMADITGQLRIYERYGDGDCQQLLSVFAEKIGIVPECEKMTEDRSENWLYLEGYLCKKPVFRRTPMGSAITNILLAVNRGSKADYIPCIAWDGAARWVSGFDVGKKLKLVGRLQSREYAKMLNDGECECETRMAYEVSIMKLES